MKPPGDTGVGLPDRCAEMRAACQYCGGTGDIHRIDGEWVGICDCPFGDALRTPTPERTDNGPT